MTHKSCEFERRTDWGLSKSGLRLDPTVLSHLPFILLFYDSNDTLNVLDILQKVDKCLIAVSTVNCMFSQEKYCWIDLEHFWPWVETGPCLTPFWTWFWDLINWGSLLNFLNLTHKSCVHVCPGNSHNLTRGGQFWFWSFPQYFWVWFSYAPIFIECSSVHRSIAQACCMFENNSPFLSSCKSDDLHTFV